MVEGKPTTEGLRVQRSGENLVPLGLQLFHEDTLLRKSQTSVARWGFVSQTSTLTTYEYYSKRVIVEPTLRPKYSSKSHKDISKRVLNCLGSYCGIMVELRQSSFLFLSHEFLSEQGRRLCLVIWLQLMLSASKYFCFVWLLIMLGRIYIMNWTDYSDDMRLLDVPRLAAILLLILFTFYGLFVFLKLRYQPLLLEIAGKNWLMQMLAAREVAGTNLVEALIEAISQISSCAVFRCVTSVQIVSKDSLRGRHTVSLDGERFTNSSKTVNAHIRHNPAVFAEFFKCAFGPNQRASRSKVYFPNCRI